MHETGIYDSLFKAIILENDNLGYVKNIVKMITGIDITKLDVLNTEILVKKKSNIRTRVDVFLKGDDNLYLIEMNKSGKEWINERNYFNLYKCGNFLYKKGEKCNQKRKLVLLSFDNFDYYDKNKLIYKARPSEEIILQVDNENLIIYHINLTYLEKNCYNKDVNKIDDLERYLLLLLVKDKEERKQIAGGDEILEKVNQTIEEYNSEDYNNLFYSQELEWQQTIDEEAEKRKAEGIALGEAKGRTIGLAEGRAQGIAETTKNLAKKMVLSGVAVDVISKITNLDASYIATL